MPAAEKLPVVLFVPSNDANFREMAVVAEFLERKHRARPVFVPEKASAIHSQENSFSTLISESFFLRCFLKALLSVIGRLYPACKEKRQSFQLSVKLRSRFASALKILHNQQPVSIVLRGDRHLGEGWEPAFIRAGKQLDIPTIVLTYSYTSDPESLLYRRRNRLDLDGSKVKDIERRFPGQFFFDKKTRKNILYRPLYALEALQQNSMLPRYPWVMGGGNSDYIVVAGESTRQRLIRLGCKKEKIVVTGLAVHDQLYNTLQIRDEVRRQTYLKYGFNSDKLLLLVSPLQLYEEKLTDLVTAQQELSTLMELCSQLDANILVSLHPRMKRSLYADIITRNSIPIAAEQLFDIIACADIFTAPYSSTVEWAVMCGIPTVIYDVFGLNYSIYDDYKGVVITTEKAQYLEALNQLILRGDHYQRLVDLQRRIAKDLSPFDGNCLSRIIDIIVQQGGPDE